MEWLYLHIAPAPAGMVQEAEHECEAAEIEDDDGSGRVRLPAGPGSVCSGQADQRYTDADVLQVQVRDLVEELVVELVSQEQHDHAHGCDERQGVEDEED